MNLAVPTEPEDSDASPSVFPGKKENGTELRPRGLGGQKNGRNALPELLSVRKNHIPTNFHEESFGIEEADCKTADNTKCKSVLRLSFNCLNQQISKMQKLLPDLY